MQKHLQQLASRLTGLSTPLFGVSWNPPVAERDVAAQLLAELEDRRVLYNPSDAEVAHHCVQSVIEVRRQLSALLVKLGGAGDLADHLRAMGAASRRFLDRVGHWSEADYGDVTSIGHYRSWEFLDALGQMRGIFGVHLAMISGAYGIQVQGDLRSILPAETQPHELERS